MFDTHTNVTLKMETVAAPVTITAVLNVGLGLNASHIATAKDGNNPTDSISRMASQLSAARNPFEPVKVKNAI